MSGAALTALNQDYWFSKLNVENVVTRSESGQCRLLASERYQAGFVVGAYEVALQKANGSAHTDTGITLAPESSL